MRKSEELADFRPRVCVQCAEAPCITVCPVNALSRNDDNPAIVLDVELCIGCRNCVEACPYEGCFFDETGNRPLICDLCGGDPACVEACRFPQAIRYERDEGGA